MKQKPTHKQTGKPAVKPAGKKEVQRTLSKPSALNQYLDKHGLWISLGLVLMLIMIIFFDFITGNRYYLFKDIGSDSINAVYPQLVLLAKYIRQEGFPLWSFAQGMGQNIMPTVGDPFNLIVMLGGADNAAYTMVIMELVKIVLISWLFFLFLGYWNLSTIARITGTLLYSFSGFILVGGSWMVFSTEAFCFTLLLLAFEKIFSSNSWYLFPLAIALIAVVQSFDLFIMALFLIIYFVFRVLSSPGYTLKKFLILSVRLLSLSLLGILISSFFLVSNIMLLVDSPRVSGNSSYFDKLLSIPLFGTEGLEHNLTAVFRFFGNDLLGNGSNFHGWYNYLEAPMTYIGLLPLLLFPQVFLFLNRREKLIYSALFLIFFLPFVFPFFRHAFWAFSGDYYRIFSLFISLVLLIFTLRALTWIGQSKKANLLILGGTFVVLLFLIFYPYPNIDQLINKGLRSFIVLMLFIYALLIVFISYSKNRNFGYVLLLVAVMIETGWVNSRTVNDRDSVTRKEWKQKAGYNDYTKEAVEFLKTRDSSFYRVDKDYFSGPAIHTSFNDAKIQDFYGTMSYYSFNQKYYIRFLEEIGTIKMGKESQTRWATGFRGKPLLHRIGSVKYILTKQSLSDIKLFGVDLIGKAGDINIVQNQLCLPLGFSYDRYIPFSEFRKLPGMQKEIMLFKAFVAEEPLNQNLSQFQALTARDSTAGYTMSALTSDVNALRKDTLQVETFSNNKITGTVNLDGQRMVFFSIPYDKGWRAKIDGKPSEPVLCNIGFTGLLVPAGQHRIELSFVPLYFYQSLWLSLGALSLYLILIGYHAYRRKYSHF